MWEVVVFCRQRQADGLRDNAKMAAAALYLNIKTIRSWCKSWLIFRFRLDCNAIEETECEAGVNS